MRLMRAGTLLLACAVAVSMTSAVLAQATNYSSVETTSGIPIRLSYHASAHKNCTPAPPPTIKVTERPKAGALVVRGGTLATNKVPGCERIRVPVQAVFYNPREGYVGPDHVIYAVTDLNGQVTNYDTTITVKAAPPGSTPSNPPKGKPGTKI